MRPKRGDRYVQGQFKPLNPGKYVGNVNEIFFRSSWELKYMSALDTDPNVVSWASEEVIVPYYDPVSKKPRRYFPDFLVKEADHTVTMVEIKPAVQTVMPTRGKKSKKRFISEATTWMTNDAKWKSAKEFCTKKGWKFLVMDERDLGIRPRSK